MSGHNGSRTAGNDGQAKYSLTFILNADGSELEPSPPNPTLSARDPTIVASPPQAQPRCSTQRSAFILTRPLSGALWLPWLADTSAGKTSLNHWGLLITELDVGTIQAVLTATEHRYPKALHLGTLFELSRQVDQNNVHVNTNFDTFLLHRDWPLCTHVFTGVTTYTDEEIQMTGAASF
jgi:hypothetical protein